MRKAVPLAALASATLASAVLLHAGVGHAGGPDGPTTVLVSRAGPGGPGGDRPSFAPSVSADGRYVAFVSRSANLLAGAGGVNGRAGASGPSGHPEVYLRDVQTGTTTVVSRADGPHGAVADGWSGSPSISADGSRVAFVSAAANLGARPEAQQVFVRDLAAGTTTLVSRADGVGGAVADAEADSPDLSADGEHVAFATTADDLRPAGAPKGDEIYVRDLAAGKTEFVAPVGEGGADEPQPTISGDGSRVAFMTNEALVPEDLARPVAESTEDIYVLDRPSHQYTLVSRHSGLAGAPSKGASGNPTISDDGSHVAFESNDRLAGHEPFGGVYVRDLASGVTTWAGEGNPSGNVGGPLSLSADGRYVAFSSESRGLTVVDPPNRADVLVRDTQTGLVIDAARASGSLGLPANAPSMQAALSADGRFVAFVTRATNLSDVDSDRYGDVFLRRLVYAKERPLPKCAGRTATQIGTPGRDVISGTSASDVIIALGGNDRIRAFSGADVVCAGPGRDIVEAGKVEGPRGGASGMELIRGEGGNDLLKGGEGPAVLRGGPGNDTLIGTRQCDRLLGEAGNDVLRGERHPSYCSDQLSGGSGRDRIER